MDEVADGTEGWDLESLTKELEAMNKDNSKMLLKYQKWMTRFRATLEKPQKLPKTSTRVPPQHQEVTSRDGGKTPNLCFYRDQFGHGDTDDKVEDEEEEEDPADPPLLWPKELF